MNRNILYVVTEDWFFLSHFAPMAEAARESGYRVSVACRCGPGRAELERRGFSVIPLDGDRRQVSVASAWREAAMIRRAIRGRRIDLVHFIALRPILIGFLLKMTGVRARAVYALTGRGWLGIDSGWKARLLRWALKTATPRLFARRGSWFLFENRDDHAFLGLPPDHPRISVLGGAGVDPERWRELPLPPLDRLRCALVGRMLRSKGVADAVEAVRLARMAGVPVELTLVGAPDPQNPASHAAAELEAMGRIDGVAWQGRSDEVAAVWAAHHLCLQPSLEAEGLPRSLLEAAASGRGIITTDTPGCRDFVRGGVEGRVTPPRDPARIAAVLAEVWSDPEKVRAWGAAARARVLDGHTIEAVTRAVLLAYDRALR